MGACPFLPLDPPLRLACVDLEVKRSNDELCMVGINVTIKMGKRRRSTCRYECTFSSRCCRVERLSDDEHEELTRRVMSSCAGDVTTRADLADATSLPISATCQPRAVHTITDRQHTRPDVPLSPQFMFTPGLPPPPPPPSIYSHYDRRLSLFCLPFHVPGALLSTPPWHHLLAHYAHLPPPLLAGLFPPSPASALLALAGQHRGSQLLDDVTGLSDDGREQQRASDGARPGRHVRMADGGGGSVAARRVSCDSTATCGGRETRTTSSESVTSSPRVVSSTSDDLDSSDAPLYLSRAIAGLNTVLISSHLVIVDVIAHRVRPVHQRHHLCLPAEPWLV